jgi:hypothetical protein
MEQHDARAEPFVDRVYGYVLFGGTVCLRHPPTDWASVNAPQAQITPPAGMAGLTSA